MEQRRSIYGALVAAAQVTSLGAFTGQVLGFSAIVPALNQVTLTLSNPIDVGDRIVVGGVNGATAGGIRVEQTDDETIVVTPFTALGEAALLPFKIALFRYGVGLGDRP